MLPMILILIFVSTWLAVVGIYALVQQRRQLGDRLVALTGGGAPMSVDVPRTGPLTLQQILSGEGLVERLKMELWRADLKLRPADFVLLVAGSALLLGGLCLVLSGKPLFGLLAALMGAGAPIAVLKLKQSQRRALFESQLPDALTLLSSSLRSGYSFLQSLQMVVEQMPSPVSEESKRVLEEVGVGFTLDEGLKHLVERVQSYDVDLMVTAISIQYEVGGNLAELLDNIGETIRERFRTRGEITALTAEGRLSGIVLFLLPLVMLAILTIRNPDYMRPLYENILGQLMLGGAFFLQVIGGIIIYRMLQIDT
jgi:tight adherence protein B